MKADKEAAEGALKSANGKLAGISEAGSCACRSLRPDICLVIFVDELDVVRSLPFSTDEFFAISVSAMHGGLRMRNSAG